MSAQSNELFDIIKSLTPQEKTFFKAYFLKTKDEAFTPSFLILFDAMNELEGYDRQKLKLLLGKKGFAGNYFKAQTYLTEAILKALVEYHSETEKSIKINNLFQQTNMLLKKNLYHTAKKYFEKARKLVESTGMYEYQLMADHLEFSFHKKNEVWMDSFGQNVSRHLETFRGETTLRMLSVQSLNHAIEFYDLHVPLSAMRKKVSATLQKVNETAQNLNLNNFSRSRYFSAKVQCLMILGELKELEKTIREYSSYLQSLPHTTAFFAKTALHGYNSILITHIHTRNFGAIEKTFASAEKYFRSIPKKICTPDISTLYYSYIVENMLAYGNETGQPEKTLSIWEKNRKEILQFNKKSAVSLYEINVAYAAFMHGDFHGAVRLANKIAFESFRPAAYCEARLLLLLAHFELNNLDILASLAKTARRAYEKSNILSSREKILFRFFEKTIHKVHSRSEERSAFIDLREAILDSDRTSRQNTTPGSINIPLWVESKITHVPFAEVVAKNAE